MDAPHSYGQPPDAVDADGDRRQRGEDDSNAETTLVDRSIFGGEVPSPGTKVKFTVVREYEDEVELKLLDDRSSDDEDSGSPESADDALGEMAE